MSKPYFTKYIPVEGEIKEGDRVLLPSGQIVKAVQETLGLCWWRKDGSAYQKINKNDKKLKLFLCSSRDIKVGDRVEYDFNPSGGISHSDFYVGDEEALNKAKELDAYKVIGEISPDATWVRKGDEFDEDDVKYSDLSYYISEDKKLESEIYLIKCPTCGHFH